MLETPAIPMREDFTKATGRKKHVNPITGEEELDPQTGDEYEPKLTLSPSKAAAAVTNYMKLKISKADNKDPPKLWRYDGQIWLPDGDRQVGNLIDSVIGDLSYEKGLRETMRRVRALSDTVEFDGNPYIFPAQDKIIDLQKGEVRDFLPEDNLTFKYGAAYDDLNADFRPALWLLCSSLPDPRDVLTALDIVTAACIRLPFEAIIQLIGPGGNGKGLFEKMIIALCTPDRVAVITLVEAKSSRFGPAAVLGKDLWVLSEVENVKDTINLLKKVSTGELTDSDTKYNGRVRGKPHVLPVLDCNNPIDFGDNSWGRMRRVVKLDFPYRFDYVTGTRHKDPHLEEKITSPAALSGLLEIVAARGPFLCRSRKIYSRKRPDQMDAEYKRQQFSLQYFCEDCLINKMPANEDGEDIDKTADERLETDALYNEYTEYCTLFNVTVPVNSVQLGKFISAKFNIQSSSTTKDKKHIRYYPGLYLSKTAKQAHADLTNNYNNYTSTTDQLQGEEDGNDISGLLTTATTEGWPPEVIEEIERMFKYVQSCEDPQKISYECYLQNAVVTVVPVVSGQQIPIEENSAAV